MLSDVWLSIPFGRADTADVPSIGVSKYARAVPIVSTVISPDLQLIYGHVTSPPKP